MSVAAAPVAAPQAASLPTAPPRLFKKSVAARGEKLAFAGKLQL